ncbi:MAG: hypothetical protein JSS81_00840 [Acidobacteria bacterium]|nr:hypothetical protein [Acidobacteriota bacterium]
MFISAKDRKHFGAAATDHAAFWRTAGFLTVIIILLGICFCGPAVGQERTRIDIDWTTTAERWRGEEGTRYDLKCPANGTISDRLWGTDVYTDDSSICTAAVHAGFITAAKGGAVTIQIIPGQPGYRGSRRNNVTSGDYGEWTGSFVFVRYYN